MRIGVKKVNTSQYRSWVNLLRLHHIIGVWEIGQSATCSLDVCYAKPMPVYTFMYSDNVLFGSHALLNLITVQLSLRTAVTFSNCPRAVSALTC